MTLGVRKTKLLGVAAVAIIAINATGCSSLPSVPDWVDPTTWFGDDNASAADNAQTPDIAGLPDKPSATRDDQAQVAESLASDRKNAKYSADALRGGTEAAAAPPPDMPATQQVAAEDEQMKAPKQSAAPASPPVRVASVDRSVAQEPSGTAMRGTLPATAPGYAVGAPPADAVQTASLPEPPAPPPPPPVRPSRQAVASVAAPARAPLPEMTSPPAGAQPALPPTPAVPQQVGSVNPSDAALGFKPSNAPPLDPSISQFVAAPIIDHYRQTAANAGVMAGSGVPVSIARPTKLRRPTSGPAMGGPEQMTGAVVANLDALQTSTPVPPPSAYANTRGLPATAVVFFPNDTVSLSADGKAQVRAAVEQYRAGGGQGYIRVVGHSSSRTANMAVDKHLEIIFSKSQDRANAVAQEIIREGVPADKVLVEAVGDTQPVYYESMPKGEDGNRRAEIFLQS